MIKTIKRSMAAVGMLAAMVFAAPGLAVAQPTTFSGMITARDGSTIEMQSGSEKRTVEINSATKIRGTSGALGVRGEEHPPSDLIRGLAIQVTASPDGDKLLASEITFKNADLKTAQQIRAGLVGTEERIDNIGDFVARDRTKVFFKTGSSALSEQGKKDLQAIAAKAKAIKGYRLAVVGRADTTGNVAANQRLSEARAAAVTNYLLKNCGILPGRILPTASLGDSPIADDPDPPKTDAEARRVTVTIAVSKSAG
jgi:outer membrane protein OmpA-like peptidoglycan-associated protein